MSAAAPTPASLAINEGVPRLEPRRSGSIGLLIPIFLIVASGLISVAFADAAARGSKGSKETLFWIGIVLIVVPIVARLCTAGATRRERIWLVVLLGLSLYLTKVMYSPTRLVFSDEFVEFRVVQDIVSSGHLFSFNPLLPVSASYPGLPNATVGLSQLSGLPISTSAMIVIGSARIVLMLAIFFVVERLSGSQRVAGLGCALYAANPNFLYWSSQFDYESLALPLFAFTMFLVVMRSQREGGIAAGVLAGASVLAVVITHHLTSYLMAGVLVVWTIVAMLRNRQSDTRRHYAPLGLALLSLAAILIWLAAVAGSTDQYLGSIAASAGGGLVDTITGSSSTRTLFSSGAEVAPLWERGLSVVSVVITLIGLALATVLIWRRRRAWPTMLPLLAMALIYPLLLPLRFIGSSQETATRSTEFLYLGLGAVLAVGVFNSRPRRWSELLSNRAWAALVCVVIILGGVAVSWQYSSRLPQDPARRSVPYELSTQAIGADIWSAQALGPERRFASDVLSRLGLATYGGQRPLYAPRDGISSWQILAPEKVDASVRKAIRDGEVQYVLVEGKLHDGIPSNGYYFDRGEPLAGMYRHPISRRILDKFGDVPGVSRIYDNGQQRIFDVSGLR